jgi:hypothetical protein
MDMERPKVPDQRFILRKVSDTEQEVVDTMNHNAVVGMRKYIGNNRYEGFDENSNSLGEGSGDEVKEIIEDKAKGN